MNSFHSFVPKLSIPLLESWIDELDVKLRISKPRKTKLGDFKLVNNTMFISVNNNLNKYSFLITLVHELAHAYVYQKYQNKVKPHGNSWKYTFKRMLLNFLTPDYFPEDVLKVLSKHIINPKASTFSDINLVKALSKFDIRKRLTVSDILEGDEFILSNGNVFIKGKKMRTRFRCTRVKTKQVYLFHPFAEVKSIQ